MVDMTNAPDSLRQINNVLSTLATGIRVCSWLLSDSDSEDAENWSLIISSALRHAFVSICGFTRSLRGETLIDVYHKPITQSSRVDVCLSCFSLRPLDPVLIESSFDQLCPRLTVFVIILISILNQYTIESTSSFDTFAD